MPRPPLPVELLFLAGVAWLAARVLDRAATGFGWAWRPGNETPPSPPVWAASAALALGGCALAAVLVLDVFALVSGR